MKLPFTRKTLINWAGEQVVREADALVERGAVLNAECEPPLIRGTVLWSNREVKTALRLLPGGHVQNECPCYTNKERGLICNHAIALALSLIKRATDPLRQAKYMAEQRRAERLAAIHDEAYIRRAGPETPGAVPAQIRVTLDADWPTALHRGGAVPATCELMIRGNPVPADRVPKDVAVSLEHVDDNLLYVLEDVSEGPALHDLMLKPADLVSIVRLHAGRALHCRDSEPIQVGETRMTTHLQMDLDRENGELILVAHTELPFTRPTEFPVYVVAGRDGWVFGGGHFWPLAAVLPRPYHAIYTEPIIVRRPDVLRFLQHELPRLAEHVRVESDISLDLFTVEPAVPGFRLLVRGSPASLSATLYAAYDGLELVAGKPDAKGSFAFPDPSDLLRFTVRNKPREAQALEQLRSTGFVGECGDALTPIVSRREVMNFLGSCLPALRRRGWRVDFEGRVDDLLEGLDFVTPVVHIDQGESQNWFDVSFDFENGTGASVSAAEIQLALRKGEAFLEHNGRTYLIDADAVESMNEVFADCASEEAARPGHFRLNSIYGAFVKASLDGLDGVDVEDTPSWRGQADRANRTMRIEPVDVGERLERIMRPYQRDGVFWLRFLEQNGFGGLLADEMGLGKTLQALVWLQLSRAHPEAQGKPALVVCPTSLVENWAEEAAKFTPDLRVLILSGRERHERRQQLPDVDLAITSYALLRRDLDEYRKQEFSAAILDEAQHIKNRSTLNAIAAKQLRAQHRVVLTGTPMENTVADLWSIMDFLMPGYLGRADSFRAGYEQPIGRGGPDGEWAQTKLRRKLQPFLLRRLKTEVARDLPPKIQRIATCRLSPDQQAVYREILNASRNKLRAMVSKQGFHRCRMEVLTVLTRLRQVCCHLDLLKLPGLTPEQPSAKMEHFFELLDQAIDSNHRVLVFSQFVSMLQILRKELDARHLTYCYLDGATQDRMSVVHRFNTQRDIPVFLISLKAGGTGLNLTGADMVVHFDPWWNPAVEDQATDRAYRIGQKRTVYSVKLITHSTVEEKVLALQRRKKDVINATVESDEAVIKSLTWDDVEALLEL